MNDYRQDKEEEDNNTITKRKKEGKIEAAVEDKDEAGSKHSYTLKRTVVILTQKVLF